MSDTYYAIKRRERQRAKENTRAAAAKVVSAPEVDRRELQAQAKELDIPANQSNEALTKAIEKKAKTAEKAQEG